MDTYVALDLETTGLSPKTDRIIEIGAVKVKQHEVVERFAAFVDPQMQIPPRIQVLTGITDDMVAGGLKTEQAVSELMEFCGDSPLLGHNIIFDFSFIKHKAVNMGTTFERDGVDTLKIARKMLQTLPSRRLGELCKYYGIASGNAHRAADDALAAHFLYQKLRDEFEALEPKLFAPLPLLRAVKKQSPATRSQKVYLNDLVKYHRIELDVQIDSLTKNEASKLIDHIIFENGRIKR